MTTGSVRILPALVRRPGHPPMPISPQKSAAPHALKKDLLRQAVAENVATLRGETPPARPRPGAAPPPASRRRRLWLAALPLVALVALAFVATGSTTRPSPVTEPALDPAGRAATATAEASATTAGRETDFADLSFPAPQALDARLFPLEVKRVVLDPGHGGDDLGTAEHGLAEKDLTLDIARRLRDLLVADGYEVLLTRDDDGFVSLRDRAQLANRAKADAFVSIHINWIASRRVRGIETYLLGQTDDPHLKELARRENRDSGYTLADMRNLLDEIYAGFRQEESRQLAAHVQRSLFHSLRTVNPELADRGVKTAPFVVLVATEMPAILAEVSCLSNAEEAELLGRPLYRAHIAEALHRGLRGFARDVNQIEEKGS